jgi:hypothetical protein
MVWTIAWLEKIDDMEMLHVKIDDLDRVLLLG